MDREYPIGNCSVDAVAGFKNRMSESMSESESIRGQMWKVNALLVVNAILAGVMVGIGAYGQRYRHHPLTRFLFLGATALFLPVVSYVVSTIGNQSTIGGSFNHEEDIHHGPFITVQCSTSLHSGLVLVWTALVQIVGISTSAVVVAGDAREGRNVGPPTVLLVQAIWTTYLALHAVGTSFDRGRFEFQKEDYVLWLFLMLPFALTSAKLVFKFYAFYEAQLSFSLGRNPRVVVGYMEQLQDGRQHADPASEHVPPPFIVMGEQTLQVEEQPHGYHFTRLMCESDQGDRTRMDNNGLVTIEKVWQLDDMLLRTIPRLKEVCFSFSLFKLLRCRFAGYTAAEAGFTKADNFLWQVLLKDNDHESVLGVITDKLSFLHDYYYSSLPISYSKHWLPVVSIFTSLLTISYCLFAGGIVVYLMLDGLEGQLTCWISQCVQENATVYLGNDLYSYGSSYYDIVPVYLLCALAVLAEARDIASYICSNWTKVGLICRHVVNHDTWQRSPSMQKWVGRVLRCRCKLMMKQWDNKMNQCSVLVLHPTKTPVVLLMRLLRLPDQKKNVKVPAVVKVAIVDALRSNDGLLSNGAAFLCRSLQDDGGNFLWACSGQGTADIMLMWHIATSILEVKHPHPPASGYKITATHLSRYCAYLVAYVPELLPDDDPWCKSLYKAVKKDSERVLASGVEAEYGKLVALLSDTSEHEVLKKGARLVKQLVEFTESEETAWRVLAGFWSEMILYVAPSDNLNGHAEAIARGGELITLVWALLMHVGIVTRPSAAEGAPAATSA